MEKKHIIGISFAVIALFLFLAISGFNEVWTGKAVDNIQICFDNDKEDDIMFRGYVKGSFTPDAPKNDYCINSNTLGEYYCDESKSDGKVKEIDCEFGCKDGVCLSETNVIVCDKGCPYNGECLPVGTRVTGKYCDYTQALKVQIEGSCENNYECTSNLCLSGDCLSEDGGKNLLNDAETTYFWE